MAKCKNCSAEIKEGLEFCDFECHYGFMTRQYADLAKSKPDLKDVLAELRLKYNEDRAKIKMRT